MSQQMVQRAFLALVERADTLGLLQTRPKLRWGRPVDFPAARDHGFTDGRVVTVAPKLARAALRRVLGLLAHELGHVSMLQSGYPDHTEIEADEVGQEILAIPLGYDRQDVQKAGLKRKRPKYLPNPRQK